MSQQGDITLSKTKLIRTLFRVIFKVYMKRRTVKIGSFRKWAEGYNWVSIFATDLVFFLMCL
jgi:hypothetical protein